MKARPSSPPWRSTRGSAFITVLLFTFMMLALVTSILGWSLNERRLNTRNGYWLEARNAAEALAEYGFSQISSQFSSHASPASLDPQGSSPLNLPPASFFAGGNVDTAAYSSTCPTGMELIGGTVVNVPSSGMLYYVDPNDPNNQFDTLKGQYVFRRDIQVLARATVRPPNGSTPISAYVMEKVSVRGSPLFAHAVFYASNDLEVAPGPTLDIYGPVHVNGNMFLSSQGTVETGTASYVSFHGPVSATGNIYHAWANSNPAAEGRGYGSSSSSITGEPLGNDPVNFTNSVGTMINMQNTSGVWNDSTLGASSSLFTSGVYTDATTPALTQLQPKLSSSYRQYAAQTWGGYVQTAAMGVQSYDPISFQDPIDAAGHLPDTLAAEQANGNYYYINDPPNTGLSTSDPYYSAKHELEQEKFSNQTGLYVKVAVTPGSNGAPDSATVTLYGWPGSAPTGTPAAEIGPNGGILLGTVPAGLVTFVPFGANSTSTTKSYSVGAKLTSGTYSGKYPQTPTTTTTTTLYNSTFSYSSSASPVTGTVTYTTGSTPLSSSTSTTAPAVTSGMYDQRQTAGINLVSLDMGALNAAMIDLNNSSKTDGKAILDSSGNVWGAGTANGWNALVAASSGWNGAIYVDVNAPAGNQTSVAVVNGKVASGNSLLPTVNSVSGLTIATNAPMYVVGNFNTAGDNPTVATAATTPDDGYTDAAGTPVSAEIPVALISDSISILSGNYFGTVSSGNIIPATNNGTSSFTTSGTVDATGSSSGSVNGTSAYNSMYLRSTSATAATSGSSSPSVEIAAAFITGVVATSGSNFSGGVHNLPRFLENWGSNTVAIRGSLSAMYQSKIATGPWAQQNYSAPKRNWGFDNIFKNGHYPPITPKVMSYRRVDFTDLSLHDNGPILGYLTLRHNLWPTEF